MRADINLSISLPAFFLMRKDSQGKSQWIFWYFFLLYFPESPSACCRRGIGQAAVSGVRAQGREGKAQSRAFTVRALGWGEAPSFPGGWIEALASSGPQWCFETQLYSSWNLTGCFLSKQQMKLSFQNAWFLQIVLSEADIFFKLKVKAVYFPQNCAVGSRLTPNILLFYTKWQGCLILKKEGVGWGEPSLRAPCAGVFS